MQLFGLDGLDPIVLAALADERPMLLIGPHGTGKSELLNRLSAALGLEHRHYNASLISFDDLLGYPVPSRDRSRIEFIGTPADIWGAESVFLDEISRCRPETQNKLFSIIHERSIQGIPLSKLRYTWAAMNPPPGAASEDTLGVNAEGYTGTFPLDAALADRFAYVVDVPSLYEISAQARLEMLEPWNREIEEAPIRGLVESAREHRQRTTRKELEWITSWVLGLPIPLRNASLPISGRRAVMLAESVRSVLAAQRALGRRESIADAAWLALRYGIPHRACGIPVPLERLSAIHRHAASAAGEDRASPWHAIRTEEDPVRRIGIALWAPPDVVSPEKRGVVITDAYAELKTPERYMVSLLIAGDVARSPCLGGPAIEIVLDPLLDLIRFTSRESSERWVDSRRERKWRRLRQRIVELPLGNERDGVVLMNAMKTLFVKEKREFSPDRLLEQYRRWREELSRIRASMRGGHWS